MWKWFQVVEQVAHVVTSTSSPQCTFSLTQVATQTGTHTHNSSGWQLKMSVSETSIWCHTHNIYSYVCTLLTDTSCLYLQHHAADVKYSSESSIPNNVSMKEWLQIKVVRDWHTVSLCCVQINKTAMYGVCAVDTIHPFTQEKEVSPQQNVPYIHNDLWQDCSGSQPQVRMFSMTWFSMSYSQNCHYTPVERNLWGFRL